MTHVKHANHVVTDEFEQLASDLSIAVWNRIAQLPQFGNLHPKDFPFVYESVHDELKRMRVKPPEKGAKHG